MRARLVICLAAILPVSLSAGQEEEAVRVYREVHGCVVALTSLEGSGTGIVLDRNGLILTNAHVVASPLPFKCVADVRQGGKDKTVTFKKVQILGVHPTKDMALVRVDTKEHKGTLNVAELAKRKGTPGQRIYAIGNPSGGGGIDLNKTITSGILSGVDRVIDEVAYYQISAPINPGNSGGPLCNKAGEVIGIVTLKFTDVENVGFAIPLHDLNVRDFVPMSKRKGDPAKAREALALASEFWDKHVEVRTQKGLDDPDAKLLSAYAAFFYHEALYHDPGNSAIYYNVGMLLRGLDKNEVAEAYLRQAVELDPWREPDYYRELGFALAKQAKKKEAHAAWQEGVDKFPAKGAKIWEDLAIFWANDSVDLYKASYAAAVVLELKAPGTRLEVAKSLYDTCSAKLGTSEQKRLASAMRQIADDLRQQQIRAGKMRQAGKPFLFEDFATYVTNSGTLEDDAVAKIDPVEPKPVEPVKSRETIELDLTVPEGSVDLLADINPKNDAVKGSWKFAGRALASPLSGYARLQIPTKLPDEYDLTLILERKSNRKEFVIGFVRSGVQSAFFLDADTGQASGIDPAARGAHRGQVLTNNQPATVVCKIRKEGLLVTVDGERIFFERTDKPFATTPTEWAVRSKSQLFIGSHISSYHVHKLMLTEYKRAK